MAKAPLIIAEVATPDTPAALTEGLYADNGTLPRLRRVDSAGNIWPSADILMMALSADYTLASSATAQKIFNSSTNGAITLPASSSYLLEMELMLTNTGTTSHTWALLFAGAASLTALDYQLRGRSGITSLLTLTADSSASQQTGAGALPTTGLVATAASTSATENVLLSVRGVLRINAGGTFIPQIKASADPVGTQKILRGSFIRLTPFGSDTATNLGNWS